MRETLHILSLVLIGLVIGSHAQWWQNWESVPNCPLETHPDSKTMYLTRDPLGNRLERSCPPKTAFSQTMCTCITDPPPGKCNLRPSRIGPHYYEEYIYGNWIMRPCGPGSAYNPTTCDCSIFF